MNEAAGVYKPTATELDQSTEEPNGTTVSLTGLKRTSPFDAEGLADSLSRLFIVDDTQFVPQESTYCGKLTGMLMTAETPIAPASGLRGVTLFSRHKLVNAPEFFSSSTSSHFYQYLTGWISVDFIDDLDDDVISTNRQSLDWEHPETAGLRLFLAGSVDEYYAGRCEGRHQSDYRDPWRRRRF